MIDFNLESGSPTLNKDVDLIIQQIDMLFDTKPKEVLGKEDYGTKYDEYLYKLKLSNVALEQTVKKDLAKLNLFGFSTRVKVHLIHGTEQDIALIEITIFKDDEYYQQIYKIS